MSKTIFEVVAKFGKKVRLTEGKCDHVCKSHPEVTGEIGKMKETLVSPQMIRRSLYDEKVWLFYRFFEDTPVTEKYLMVAARILNDEGFVVTSYFTDKVKMGEENWRER
ncbi:MAG: hypothetical protein AOA66_0432 [Candidatus Bathyarchaeota archaeon BA2]|nr:MAG: hypothetical protein AOA66_0432 [Candidatus Bathyarchaeota archaeon BA2]